jgi:hypothetical protein
MDPREQKKKAEIDRLYQEVVHYRTGREFRKMMEMVKKLPYLSAYNALLVELQKPGAMFVATPTEWLVKYHRSPKPDARPLVILRTFGPVSFVYDYNDTEGEEISDEQLRRYFVYPFRTNNVITEKRYYQFVDHLIYEGVEYSEENFGNGLAAYIRRADGKRLVRQNQDYAYYVMIIARAVVNKNLSATEKFASLVHEMAHYLCGHLFGLNDVLTERSNLPDNAKEFEAETVCWLVCQRLGISTTSKRYLSEYLDPNSQIPDVSIDRICRADRAIENIFNNKSRFPPRLLRTVRKDPTNPDWRI